MNKPTIVIGFTGQKRAGKNTAAQTLRQCFADYDEEIYVGQTAFADPMYNMLKEFIGTKTVDKLINSDAKDTEIIEPFGCTLRHMMQTLGTEWGRHQIHKNAWVMSMQKTIENVKKLPDDADAAIVLITDVRFANEADFIRRRGFLIHIERPNQQSDNHLSENGVKHEYDDITITNNDDLETFAARVTDHGFNDIRQKIKALIHPSS